MRFEEDLLREFASAIIGPQFHPHRTDAVIVLDYFDPQSTGDMEARIRNLENVERVRFAAEIWHHVADKARKKQCPVPIFCLNGLTLALPHLKELAETNGIPHHRIHLLDNGAVGEGNTLTQLKLVANDPAIGRAKHVTIVSSSYHLPRIRRTANTCLPPDVKMWHSIFGVPFERIPFDVATVQAEINRIIVYSDKGDISRHGRH
ncbi:MAG: hypothetical protein EXS68_00960 [Candidatus Ryanbacteria bacterium]|nr:hypothetical protein [Candidatus Ryanbacteria bacterium]